MKMNRGAPWALVLLAGLGSSSAWAISVVRGPYLQLGSSTGVLIKWRTDTASNGKVMYGTSAGNLNLSATQSTSGVDHQVQLSGLSPNTRYYYSVGTSTQVLASGASYTFETSPPIGQAKPTRVWIVGDSGTAGPSGASASAQQQVKSGFNTFNGNHVVNLWLMVGDNAYNNGQDDEYQRGLFNIYPEMLRSTYFFPAIGNHDAVNASVYYDIFSLPNAAQAGGVASGSEAYYSYDYGNIHFIVLDSYASSRSTTGPMATWLQNDLAQNTQNWTIAYWHHSPYTHGSHNSDTSLECKEMRERFNPILEAGGVDLVFSGHSHSYERSMMIDGKYNTGALSSSQIINGSDGNDAAGHAYTKNTTVPTPHSGTVYTVAGTSGQVGTVTSHPVHLVSLVTLGSVVLDVNALEANMKFINTSGAVVDQFTMRKSAGGTNPPMAPSNLVATAVGSNQINLSWADNASDEQGHQIEQAPIGSNTFSQIATVGANVTQYSVTGLAPATGLQFRVRAYNTAGNSSYSNVASATTGPVVSASPSVSPSPSPSVVQSGSGIMLRKAGVLLAQQSQTQAAGVCTQYEAVYVDANGSPTHPATDKLVTFAGLAPGNVIYSNDTCTSSRPIYIYGTSGIYPNNYQKAKYFFFKGPNPQGPLELKTGAEPRTSILNVTVQ